jgi:hypothetical protein
MLDATKTGESYEKVIEIGLPLTCAESVFQNIDLRSRPISKELISLIKADMFNIKQGFPNNNSVIKDKVYPKAEQFSTVTAHGRLRKVREEIAKQVDEGALFVMEDKLLNELATLHHDSTNLDVLNTTANFYANHYYMPVYVQQFSEMIA